MNADTSRRQSGELSASRFDGPPGLSGNLWPVHPHRLDDELLSSWIVRTAHANRIRLQTFTNLGFGRQTALWNRDIDRSASSALLDTLSWQTGSSVEELRGGMLTAYEGTLFERHNANGNTNWILPLGIYHRTRTRYGLQFCPLCLFFDPIPYYRRAWRLAFVTMCDRHGVMLHDRCPACASPVIHFRNDLGKRREHRIGDHVSCWKCGFDLRRAPTFGPSGPDGKSIMSLRSLVAFHGFGWWFQGKAALPYGHLYFDAFHALTIFLTSSFGMRLLDFVERETSWQATLGEQLHGKRFELRPVGPRHALLVAALWLLDDWPNRFVESARSVGLTQSRILRSELQPFWFESEIRASLGAGFHMPTADEARHAAEYLDTMGCEVSARAIGGLIGSKDAWAVKAYAQDRPAALSDYEFRLMVNYLTKEIEGLQARSERRLLQQRDLTILSLLHATKWSVSKVLSLSLDDALKLSSTSPKLRNFPESLVSLIRAYLQDTRRYLADECEHGMLFVGRGSDGIGMNAWGLRMADIRKGLISVNCR